MSALTRTSMMNAGATTESRPWVGVCSRPKRCDCAIWYGWPKRVWSSLSRPEVAYA